MVSQKNKTIEEKMNELRVQAAWFESEEFSLTHAKEKFEAAAKLAREIESDLAEMENQITVLKESFETV
jgi:exonuclease VII small subunit